MFLSVYEACFILEIEPAVLYYELRMSRIDGAMKVLNCWRIDEESLQDLYERIHNCRIGETADDSRLQRFAERLENVREKYLSNPCRSTFERIQRRRRMECLKRRSNKLAEISERLNGQLFFDFF